MLQKIFLWSHWNFFSLMLPSYCQSSLYVFKLMESVARIFIVRGCSSCLGQGQQLYSLKANSPWLLFFPLCSFPCLQPWLFCFHQCEEHERRAVYKASITSFFVEIHSVHARVDLADAFEFSYGFKIFWRYKSIWCDVQQINVNIYVKTDCR